MKRSREDGLPPSLLRFARAIAPFVLFVATCVQNPVGPEVGLGDVGHGGSSTQVGAGVGGSFDSLEDSGRLGGSGGGGNRVGAGGADAGDGRGSTAGAAGAKAPPGGLGGNAAAGTNGGANIGSAGRNAAGGRASNGGGGAAGGRRGEGGDLPSGTGGAADAGDAGTNVGREGGAPYMPKFILGADISRVQEQEAAGVKFKDVDGSIPAGTTSSGGGLLTILKAHGFNYVRLRVFVDPAAKSGYSSRGYCDTDHTIQFAKGIKQAQMGFLLDFHYSDTWADPGNQTKPAAWAHLGFAELTQKVHDYTNDVVGRLAAAGARPDIVQIGNEIPSGLLWEDGRVSGHDFANLGALLKAGISGVKGVDSNIKIMMHLNQCHQLATNTWWLEGVWSEGVDFDILGESCYDREDYQQPASAWAGVFAGLVKNGTGSNSYASKYAKLQFVAAEYSDSKKLVNDTVYQIADKRGLGTFIWEPTNWGETMFDANGKAIAEHMALYDDIARTYGAR